ncbi:dCTP deaminase [Acidilobus sp.]|jgi:dCTP deaminase|uniref:dCTP deaminase n=1 Tax=Acidilobus sp. TaxID=1872109 RepID=UPI003CFDDD6A
MILSDRDIETLIRAGELGVEPLDSEVIRENGLDLRLGSTYCEFRSTGTVLDPRSPGDPGEFYDCRDAGEGGSFIIIPHRHYLLHTAEYIKLPPYVAGLVNLRSTWARTGIYIPSTVVDAGFEGQLTIEVIGSEFPVKLYVGDRFLHLVLVKMETPSTRPYSGRYRGQRGVRLPQFFGEMQAKT